MIARRAQTRRPLGWLSTADLVGRRRASEALLAGGLVATLVVSVAPSAYSAPEQSNITAQGALSR
jgi:hypothetical protein